VVVSFIGGGNRRKPVASHCQTLSHQVVLSTPHHVWDSNSQLKSKNRIQTNSVY